MSSAETVKLWNMYKTDKTVLGDLMLAYEDIVKSNAHAIARTLPNHIDVNDLIADGFFGLADAIQKFDSSFGYKFETYASFRIRGSILDQLRSADWAPRTLRAKHKELSLARSRLHEELGRDPSPVEVSELLGWEVEEVFDVQGSQSRASVSNLDDIVNVDGAKFSLSDLLPDTQSEQASDFLELKGKLEDGILVLTEEARTILSLYYVLGLSLKDIGDLMTVTESRACQIHTQALLSLWNHCLPD